MQVSKWGNSLAVRLPQSVVEALQLQAGDEIEISVVGTREFRVDRDRRRERALAVLQNSNWQFPAGWKFDRAEAVREDDVVSVKDGSAAPRSRGHRRAG